jgi:hypothetical protein
MVDSVGLVFRECQEGPVLNIDVDFRGPREPAVESRRSR